MSDSIKDSFGLEWRPQKTPGAQSRGLLSLPIGVSRWTYGAGARRRCNRYVYL